MKKQSTIFFWLLLSFKTVNASELKLDFIPDGFGEEQCGCWYHYPDSEGVNGKVIAQGDAAQETIYITLNGELRRVGNWKAIYHDQRHFIDYHDNELLISIESKVLSDSRYSSEYSSIITLKYRGLVKEVRAFGSCGC